MKVLGAILLSVAIATVSAVPVFQNAVQGSKDTPEQESAEPEENKEKQLGTGSFQSPILNQADNSQMGLNYDYPQNIGQPFGALLKTNSQSAGEGTTNAFSQGFNQPSMAGGEFQSFGAQFGGPPDGSPQPGFESFGAQLGAAPGGGTPQPGFDSFGAQPGAAPGVGSSQPGFDSFGAQPGAAPGVGSPQPGFDSFGAQPGAAPGVGTPQPGFDSFGAQSGAAPGVGSPQPGFDSFGAQPGAAPGVGSPLPGFDSFGAQSGAAPTGSPQPGFEPVGAQPGAAPGENFQPGLQSFGVQPGVVPGEISQPSFGDQSEAVLGGSPQSGFQSFGIQPGTAIGGNFQPDQSLLQEPAVGQSFQSQASNTHLPGGSQFEQNIFQADGNYLGQTGFSEQAQTQSGDRVAIEFPGMNNQGGPQQVITSEGSYIGQTDPSTQNFQGSSYQSMQASMAAEDGNGQQASFTQSFASSPPESNNLIGGAVSNMNQFSVSVGSQLNPGFNPIDTQGVNAQVNEIYSDSTQIGAQMQNSQSSYLPPSDVQTGHPSEAPADSGAPFLANERTEASGQAHSNPALSSQDGSFSVSSQSQDVPQTPFNLPSYSPGGKVPFVNINRPKVPFLNIAHDFDSDEVDDDFTDIFPFTGYGSSKYTSLDLSQVNFQPHARANTQYEKHIRVADSDGSGEDLYIYAGSAPSSAVEGGSAVTYSANIGQQVPIYIEWDDDDFMNVGHYDNYLQSRASFYSALGGVPSSRVKAEGTLANNGFVVLLDD